MGRGGGNGAIKQLLLELASKRQGFGSEVGGDKKGEASHGLLDSLRSQGSTGLGDF